MEEEDDGIVRAGPTQRQPASGGGPPPGGGEERQFWFLVAGNDVLVMKIACFSLRKSTTRFPSILREISCRRLHAM